jgi:tetratricopeptide repeat protein
MADAALTRQAGRFVWLELDYDKPENQGFLQRHGVAYTPSLFVLDPATERARATHVGGMTIPELNRFLDGAMPRDDGRTNGPAGAALARGDELFGRGRYSDASAGYREALRLAPPAWPEHGRAIASLAWALWVGGESQASAETAAAEAPTAPRGPEFARLVLAGLGSATQGGDAPWAQSARKTLESLAAEAVALPGALRDHRFQLYQHLTIAARMRGDAVTAARWTHRWLDEIDATSPKDDDERSALDIARVDAASDAEDFARVIPALAASERAMPRNYNASLRLAQIQLAANRYDDALGACERGLAHVTGPVGRTWLLRTEADALIAKGESAKARTVLDQALRSARAIGNRSNRENNVRRTMQAIAELDKQGN